MFGAQSWSMISDTEKPYSMFLRPSKRPHYRPLYSPGTSIGRWMNVLLMLLLTFAVPVIAAIINARTRNAMAVWLILTVGVPLCPRRLFLLMVLIGVASNNFGIR